MVVSRGSPVAKSCTLPRKSKPQPATLAPAKVTDPVGPKPQPAKLAPAKDTDTAGRCRKTPRKKHNMEAELQFELKGSVIQTKASTGYHLSMYVNQHYHHHQSSPVVPAKVWSRKSHHSIQSPREIKSTQPAIRCYEIPLPLLSSHSDEGLDLNPEILTRPSPRVRAPTTRVFLFNELDEASEGAPDVNDDRLAREQSYKPFPTRPVKISTNVTQSHHRHHHLSFHVEEPGKPLDPHTSASHSASHKSKSDNMIIEVHSRPLAKPPRKPSPKKVKSSKFKSKKKRGTHRKKKGQESRPLTATEVLLRSSSVDHVQKPPECVTPPMKDFSAFLGDLSLVDGEFGSWDTGPE